MEWQLVASYDHVAEAARDVPLHDMLREFRADMIRRSEVLLDLFKRHAVHVGHDTSKAMEGLIEGGENHLGMVDQGDIRDLMIVAHCLRVHQYGVAGYGVAARLAGRLGYAEDSERLASMLAEEESAVKKLMEHEIELSNKTQGLDGNTDYHQVVSSGNKPCVYDVLILGGGPAGLSAANLLGRCMRQVLFCDVESPLFELNGWIGFDESEPGEILRQGKRQLERFENVAILDVAVDDVERDGIGFSVRCRDGRTFSSRSVLLTSGFVARLPGIPGAERFYGVSLHQCPYCDGWEHRGKQIGVIGCSPTAVDLAIKMLLWSPNVKLYIDGEDFPDCHSMKKLEAAKVEIVAGTITALEGEDRQLERIRTSGASYACDAVFFWGARKYHSALAAHLGCDAAHVNPTGCGERDGGTGVHGLFIAGNNENNIEFATVAAAEGIKVAEWINSWLMEADQSYLATST
jgi:thioredoxin reductase/ferritin-like metal-binding protein YciE